MSVREDLKLAGFENPVKVLVKQYEVRRPDGSVVGTRRSRYEAMQLAVEGQMHDEAQMLPIFVAEMARRPD